MELMNKAVEILLSAFSTHGEHDRYVAQARDNAELERRIRVAEEHLRLQPMISPGR